MAQPPQPRPFSSLGWRTAAVALVFALSGVAKPVWVFADGGGDDRTNLRRRA
jgi:hypothetical protein